MPRKPEPSFSLKQIIWDIAASIGTDNLSAIYREVDHRLEQLRTKGELFEDTPDARTVGRIIELDINRLRPEVVVDRLPRHVWHLRNDYEDIRQLAEESIEADEKPYEETSHKRKMRELAKALAGKISLPSLWDKDLWRDLPAEFRPGKYSLAIGVVEIGKDKQIRANYFDISTGIAAPHLVKGLYSHLSTSGLSKFTELLGDKGKLEDWVSEVGQYSEALLRFLRLIADEVKGYRAKVSFHDEAKPGLTRWFIITAWNDAIQKAGDYSWIDDSWYHPPENIPDTSLWRLRCGAYPIGIAKSEKTLRTYENWHKKLRVKCAENQLAKDIAAKYQELNDTAHGIRQRLQEFSDMERLPGYCELC